MDSCNCNKGVCCEALMLHKGLVESYRPMFLHTPQQLGAPSQLNTLHLKQCVLSLLKEVHNEPSLSIEIGYDKYESLYSSFTYISEKKTIYITVNSQLNTCWRRFAACKELMQIYVVFIVEYLSNPKRSLEEMLDEYNPQEGNLDDILGDYTDFQNSFKTIKDFPNIQENKRLLAECKSYIAAVDLFFPYTEKSKVKGIGLAVKRNESTSFDLAKDYRCPEYITNFYLNELQDFTLNLMTNDFLRNEVACTLKSI
ncbi:hypothetical protein [Viscerimonas tarda]